MIDCGPSVSLLNVNALAAGDGIYIPSRCEKDSRVGVANIIRLMKTVQEYTQTVSYTHLDVYKRQGQNCPLSRKKPEGDKNVP